MELLRSFLTCCPLLPRRRKNEETVSNDETEDSGLMRSKEKLHQHQHQHQHQHHAYGSTKASDEDSVSRTSSTRSLNRRSADHCGRVHDTSPPITADSQNELNSQFVNCKLGQLHYVLQFIPNKSTLYIRIIKGVELVPKDSNGLSDPYVKMHLLPDTGKRTKLRTRTCQRTLHPIWDEEFCYTGLCSSDMEAKMLRLSVLDEDTIGFDWMGEIVFPLKHLLNGRKQYHETFLQPRSAELDANLKSVEDDRGKILVGLCYSPAKSELSVRILQCVNLIAMDPNGYSDPFVKVCLKPTKEKKRSFKTEVKKRSLNPQFDEEFTFTINPHDLLKKTLEVTVWDKDFGTKNDFMGALALGHMCTGERWGHWEISLKQPYQRHDRWHSLMPELCAE